MFKSVRPVTETDALLPAVRAAAVVRVTFLWLALTSAAAATPLTIAVGVPVTRSSKVSSTLLFAVAFASVSFGAVVSFSVDRAQIRASPGCRVIVISSPYFTV